MVWLVSKHYTHNDQQVQAYVRRDAIGCGFKRHPLEQEISATERSDFTKKQKAYVQFQSNLFVEVNSNLQETAGITMNKLIR